MAGRPTKYSKDLADKICKQIATSSLGLKAICEEKDMPCRDTIYEWLSIHKEFSDNYARAKDAQADFMVEEIIEIADNDKKDLLDGEFGQQGNSAAVNRSKLMVDARKWAASKLAPKKYGEKVEHTGNIDVAITGMKIT